MTERGAVLTSNTKIVAECLREGMTAIIPFGRKDMYAWFSSDNEEHMERMASMKGRGRKPFVLTTAYNFIEEIIGFPGISPQVTPEARDVVRDFLTQNEKERAASQPIGVLLPANTALDLPERLLGKGLVSIDGQPQNTIGFMVSRDQYYHDVVKQTPSGKNNHCLAGTSANYTADSRDHGSGHHRLGGVLKDFGRDEKICIFVPPKFREEKKGPSTSIALIDSSGRQGYLVRVGSISKPNMIKLLESAGVEEIKEIDGGARYISPYQYTARETLAWWVAHKGLLLIAARRDRQKIPLSWPKTLEQLSPKIETVSL